MKIEFDLKNRRVLIDANGKNYTPDGIRDVIREVMLLYKDASIDMSIYNTDQAAAERQEGDY